MEPVAITAAAARLPGAADLDAYWARTLRAEPAPLEPLAARWGLPRERFFSPDPAAVDRTYVDRAFCAERAGLSAVPGEDPQETLAVAVLAEALAAREARPGPPLARARTGLVLATAWAGESYFQADARAVLRTLGGLEHEGPAIPPLGPDLLPRRLAERLGLGGPRLAIDTACASSLYAIEVGAGLLAAGAADAVLVSGLTGFLPLFLFVGFSRLRALSPQGTILPFSADASGILIGEGCGAVLLERPTPELPALARVVGLGLSCDGADRSVFAPGPEGQRRAYEAAYRDVDPAEVDYVEGHGTATAVGDETELMTLDGFFGPHRARPLPVGSAKGLVGHLLAAAGMASLLKGLLMLRERTLPPHLPVRPHPRLRETCCALLDAPRPWAVGERGRPRRLGISSFGFGGSNAHLVLQEAPPGPTRVTVPSRRLEPSPPARLAFVDLEVAVGSALGTEAWREALAHGRAPFSSFSTERFGLDRAAFGAAEGAALGAYFPPRLTVETQGLRMGPNLLARLDPLQLLVIELARRLLARHSAAAQPGTAVVLTSNLGGAMALRLYRRHCAQTRAGSPLTPELAAFLGPDTTLEAIASSLTPLCSGYPAYHFDLRAFHATLSGEAGTLWTALQLAPGWLAERCDALLLGAARSIKGPLDLAGGDDPPGEAAALFLLEDAARARAAGRRVLGTLGALVPGEDARDLAAACAAAGLAPERVALRERCALDGARETESASGALAGALAEASGLEALSRVLLAPLEPGQVAAIEVVRGDALLLTAFVEREARWEGAPAPLVRPREVPFVPAPLPAAAPAASAGEAPSPRLAPYLDYLEQTAAAVRAFLTLQREAAAPLVAASGAASGQGHARSEPAASAPTSVGWRARLEQALATRPPGARVLEGLEAAEVEGRIEASARLLVDEEHPYFFDHPLDHVPGILLLEGAHGLALAAAAAARPPGPDEVLFVGEATLGFRRFCEKGAPTDVRVRQRRAASPARLAWEGEVRQGALLAATLDLETEVAPLRLEGGLAASDDALAGAPSPEPALLHKRRAENVLVSILVRAPGPEEVYRCALRPPPAGHCLAAGDRRCWSLLYLLETARQAVMLGAHGVEGIPLGLPMNLLSLRVSLRGPAPRAAALSWRLGRQPFLRVGSMVIGEVRATLLVGTRELGEAVIKAQVVDADTYRGQRGERWSTA